MHGTMAGHCLSLGPEGSMAALLVVWVLAQAPAGAQGPTQTPGSDAPAGGSVTQGAPQSEKPPAAAKPQETSTSPMPPHPAPSPAPAGPANESKAETATGSRLGPWKNILQELLKIEAAKLSKGPQRKEEFKKKGVELGQEILSKSQPGARLGAEDKALLLELIYDLSPEAPPEAPPVVAAAVRSAAPGAAEPVPPPPAPGYPAPVPAAAPAALAGPLAQPGGTQVQQFAPDDPQFAPIKSLLFTNLEQRLKDFGSTLKPGSSSAEIRDALERQMASLITSFIPPPLSFLRTPAETVLKGVIESIVNKIAAGQGQPPKPPPSTETTEPGTTATKPGTPMPKRTVDSKISDLLDADLRQAAANTRTKILEKDPKTSQEDLQKKIREVIDRILVPEGLTPLPSLDEKYITDLAAAFASPDSQIKPILDELEKQLDQFNIDVLGKGIAVRTDRQDEILKLTKAWLKDKKQINFDELLPGDSELIINLIARVTRKGPQNVTITGGGGSAGGAGAGIISLPGNVTFPNLGSGIGVPVLVTPGCHLFHKNWLGGGSGYTVIIR